MPPRPSSPQLSQQSQDERVPDGYVRKQVTEKEMFQLRRQFIAESSAFKQKHDEMLRNSIAYQQQHLELAERMVRLERENEQHRLRARDL